MTEVAQATPPRIGGLFCSFTPVAVRIVRFFIGAGAISPSSIATVNFS